MKPIYFFSCCVMTLVLLSTNGYAVETATRISDREIIESLARFEERFTRLEEGQKAILREMDKRFEALDKRFETIDKRFEEQSNLLIGIMVTFGGMVAVMISFAIWDRRTMIRPFETKVRQIEKELEPLAQEAKQDRQRFQTLLETVRVLAQNNPRAAEILKGASLL